MAFRWQSIALLLKNIQVFKHIPALVYIRNRQTRIFSQYMAQPSYTFTQISLRIGIVFKLIDSDQLLVSNHFPFIPG